MRTQLTHEYVQKSYTTTLPARSSGADGRLFSQPLAASRVGQLVGQHRQVATDRRRRPRRRGRLGWRSTQRRRRSRPARGRPRAPPVSASRHSPVPRPRFRSLPPLSWAPDAPSPLPPDPGRRCRRSSPSACSAACAEGGGQPSGPDPSADHRRPGARTGDSTTDAGHHGRHRRRPHGSGVRRCRRSSGARPSPRSTARLRAGSPAVCFPYGPDTDVPDCGGPTSYDDVADNAFYCPIDDFVAWDTDHAHPPPARGVRLVHPRHGDGPRDGPRHPGIGPSVPQQPTIMLELMADCFAGAWTTWARDGGSDTFDPGVVDLDNALAGMLEFRDPARLEPRAVRGPTARPSTASEPSRRASAGARSSAPRTRTATTPSSTSRSGSRPTSSARATGRSSDRRPARHRGARPRRPLELLGGGVPHVRSARSGIPIDDSCRTTPTIPTSRPRATTSISARTSTPASPSTAPTDDIAALGRGRADARRCTSRSATCRVGIMLGTQYSKAAQFRLGPSIDDGLTVNLQADCFTGSWLAIRVQRGDRGARHRRTLRLSPGDLDEAVIAFLALQRAARHGVGEHGYGVPARRAVPRRLLARHPAVRALLLNGAVEPVIRTADGPQRRARAVVPRRAVGDELAVLHDGPGPVHPEHADQPPGAAVERDEAPLVERAVDHPDLVVGPARPASWSLRSYWSDQNHGTGA